MPYGLKFDGKVSERDIEFFCFRTDPPGGLGSFEHFRRAAALTWPDVEWNPWLERCIESLCRPGQRDGDKETRTVAWTGCGASGKTFAAGFYASLWWQADPANSIVCLTSTTKEMIGRRVWPVVQWFSTHAKDPTTGKVFNCGHMVDSRKMLQATKGDEKHAIFAMAVAQGETQKAVENLKGMHANRILLIIDEATGTPPAVVETVANMRKGCRDFTVLVIANAVSHLDCHGRVCRPEGGWESITVEDAEWKTSGVPEWELPPGICMHFDGSKSPNVVAKRTLYPFLYSWEDYRSALKHGVTKSVKFWSQTRGFWAPEGISDTILTEPLIEHHQGRSDTTFLSERKSVAFLDSAFGGDDCVAVFGAIGNTDGGDVLQIEESLLILPSAEVKDPVDHQVARQYKNACIARGVQPENAGADATGTGRGVYAILCEEWSHRVQRTEFGGAASDLPASNDDPRPSKEVYDRRVTELWFSVREFLMANQLRGLYHDAIIDLCTRTYEHIGRKIRLQTKDDYKDLYKRSPDHGDAVAGLVDVCRKVGFRAVTKVRQRKDDQWYKMAKEIDGLHNETYKEESTLMV